jgi:hypothetical protein
VHSMTAALAGGWCISGYEHPQRVRVSAHGQRGSPHPDVVGIDIHARPALIISSLLVGLTAVLISKRRLLLPGLAASHPVELHLCNRYNAEIMLGGRQ